MWVGAERLTISAPRIGPHRCMQSFGNYRTLLELVGIVAVGFAACVALEAMLGRKGELETCRDL